MTTIILAHSSNGLTFHLFNFFGNHYTNYVFIIYFSFFLFITTCTFVCCNKMSLETHNADFSILVREVCFALSFNMGVKRS